MSSAKIPCFDDHKLYAHEKMIHLFKEHNDLMELKKVLEERIQKEKVIQKQKEEVHNAL